MNRPELKMAIFGDTRVALGNLLSHVAGLIKYGTFHVTKPYCKIGQILLELWVGVATIALVRFRARKIEFWYIESDNIVQHIKLIH